MDSLKKPETLFLVILAIVVIGYIVFDYRKHNSQNEKAKQTEEHLAATIRLVDQHTKKIIQMDTLAQELVRLKERQEELEEELEEKEEIKEKYEELVEVFDDLVQSLKKNGIEVDVEVPELDSSSSKKGKKKGGKKKGGKKGGKEEKKKGGKKKGGKKGKKSKKDDSSSEEEDSSSDDESSDKAVERMSRIQEKRRSNK